MSLLLKKSDHFKQLFKGLNVQDAIFINKNIKAVEKELKVAPDKIVKLMAAQNVKIENLLAEKCISLTRFYLADEKAQLAYFLNSERLGNLFKSLPMAEATIFKEHVYAGQELMSLPDEMLQTLMEQEGLFNEASEEDQIMTNIVDFQSELSLQDRLEHLQRLAERVEETENEYKRCYYEFGTGERPLRIHKEFKQGLMLYGELSPLMQIKAQQLFKATKQTA